MVVIAAVCPRWRATEMTDGDFGKPIIAVVRLIPSGLRAGSRSSAFDPQ